MARIQITFFIIITSSVLLHTRSADVYSALLPNTVTALTGSCVQIPCTFDVPDFDEKLQNTKQIYGIWMMNSPHFNKENSLLVFNSSENITQGFSHIEMIGNLQKRNCTTVFYNIMMNHSDTYYFRLQMEPDVFRATFNTNPDDSSDSRKTVKINVMDSPHPPELSITPHVSKHVEGTSVSLRCSAEAPCPKKPPTLSWSYIPSSANITTQIQEKPDKTQSVISTITFNASYTDHKKNISCTVTYPTHISKDTTVENTITLQVLFPPKKTSVSVEPSASVSVGTNVTLTCNTKGSHSKNISYTWYRRGQETPLAWNKNITLIVTHNNTGWYFCTAQNKFGNQMSEEIQLMIKEHNGSSKSVIYGCTGGLLTLLVLSAVFVYCVRTRASSQTNIRGRDETEDKNKDMEIYSNNAVEMTIKTEVTEDETDEIHYGEIDFSELHTDNVTRKDPETEYAEIQRSKRKRQLNSDQKQEDLYAQVKTK
ncbi:B-cell receptor CD22-like isoform X2 [Triplophysa rosa]|uniref:B-cell receptor CD22-like isoform X2 n=1 Tax=Triplophysa rosa TaxID=992332 RepID=UPI002545C448|nr:B-cell receptor CD22-like isoform X2 [Triplophysa rosa]